MVSGFLERLSGGGGVGGCCVYSTHRHPHPALEGLWCSWWEYQRSIWNYLFIIFITVCCFLIAPQLKSERCSPQPCYPQGLLFVAHWFSGLFGLYHIRFSIVQANTGQAAASDHCTTAKPSYNQLRPRHREVLGPRTQPGQCKVGDFSWWWQKSHLPG